jgi:hypothetical protein
MLVLLACALLAGKEKAPKKSDVCAQPNPEAVCTPENTCAAGSCTLDVTRTASSSSVKPVVAGAKDGKPVCIPVGAKVEWQSTEKSTGFVVDPGTTSPFDPPGSIMGGYNKPTTTVATKAGCYPISFGACKSGGIYGMCKESATTIVIIKGK